MLTNTTYLFLIVTAACTSIIGNSLLRLGLKRVGIESLNFPYLVKNLFSVVFQPLVFFGFVFFAVSAIIWMRILTMESLNKSYPIIVGCMMVFLTISSAIVLHEPLGVARIAGIALIVFGTILIWANF